MRIVDLGPPQGRVLIATRPLLPGQTILLEEPVILLQDAYPLSIYRAFTASSPAVQCQILDFFAPVDGAFGTQLRAALLDSGELDKSEVDVFVRVVLAFQFNCVGVSPAPDDGGTPPDLGAALYSVACRASHSCQPNCFWLADKLGRRVVRTLVDVADGEEVCVDYNLERVDLKPVHERRAKLSGWEFLCGCPRCATHGDDTRRFHCMEATCTGHHLVHQPSIDIPAELTACSDCGTRASAPYTSRMLKQEADMIKDMTELSGSSIDAAGPLSNMAAGILRLQPPHPHHYLAAEAAHLQWELYRDRGEWERAAQALEAEIACRDAVIRFPSRNTAFCNHDRGDMLMKAYRAAGAGAGEKRGLLLAQALEAYRRAVHGLLITGGPSHPFTSVADAKLAAAVQEQGRGGAGQGGGGAGPGTASTAASKVTGVQQRQGSRGKKVKPSSRTSSETK